MNTVPNENICGLKREDFQTTVNGKKTDLFILRNALGNEVAITNYGGAVEADNADFIFVGGSSYIVADLLSSVEK